VFWVTALAATGGLVAFAALVLGAIVDLVRAAGRRRISSALTAVVGLLGAAALFFVSRFAALLAERKNHWVDPDDDGTREPFANGRPDWFDVNMEDWGGYAAIGLVVVLAAVVLARAAIRTSCSRWLMSRE
jgi:hypothetical protein